MSAKRNIRKQRLIKRAIRNAATASTDKEAYAYMIRVNRIAHAYSEQEGLGNVSIH